MTTEEALEPFDINNYVREKLADEPFEYLHPAFPNFKIRFSGAGSANLLENLKKTEQNDFALKINSALYGLFSVCKVEGLDSVQGEIKVSGSYFKKIAGILPAENQKVGEEHA